MESEKEDKKEEKILEIVKESCDIIKIMTVACASNKDNEEDENETKNSNTIKLKKKKKSSNCKCTIS